MGDSLRKWWLLFHYVMYLRDHEHLECIPNPVSMKFWTRFFIKNTYSPASKILCLPYISMSLSE